MKKLLPIALIGLIGMTGCATHRAGAPKGAVEVIAHRGASAYAPENTLAAFRLAQEQGADWFELDCTLTKDGEVIVIHDDSVDRTTNGKGAVRDLTLQELKALDAGSWKESRFASEPLPMLAEALDLAKRRVGVYIEIKDSGGDQCLEEDVLALVAGHETLSDELWRKVMTQIETSGTRNLVLTRQVIAMVHARRMAKQVVIQSFSPIICAVAIREAPDIRTEFLGSADKENPATWEQYLRWGYLLGVAGFNARHTSLDEGRLAALHAAGKTVAVWTVNEPEDMRRLASWGVDGIITNRPDVCLDILNEMGKR